MYYSWTYRGRGLERGRELNMVPRDAELDRLLMSHAVASLIVARMAGKETIIQETGKVRRRRGEGQPCHYYDELCAQAKLCLENHPLEL